MLHQSLPCPAPKVKAARVVYILKAIDFQLATLQLLPVDSVLRPFSLIITDTISCFIMKSSGAVGTISHLIAPSQTRRGPALKQLKRCSNSLDHKPFSQHLSRQLKHWILLKSNVPVLDYHDNHRMQAAALEITHYDPARLFRPAAKRGPCV